MKRKIGHSSIKAQIGQVRPNPKPIIRYMTMMKMRIIPRIATPFGIYFPSRVVVSKYFMSTALKNDSIITSTSYCAA